MTLRKILRKVPEVTAIFWLIKLLTTAVGESTSDFLVLTINPYLAVALGGVGLLIALALQFSTRRYVAWIYWLCVVMVAVFGTMAADALHIQLGISYVTLTIGFASALALVFAVWYASEKTLSIHSITSRRRELFYWAAVMTTFALGTAAGDMTAYSLHLGYFTSIILFATLIIAIALIYWRFHINAIFAFWFAYILTRPLGASVADWLGKSQHVGGLGFGDGPVSFVLALLIVISVAYITLNRREVTLETATSATS
jgi:uncharacterized membrane-anchored protein